MENQMITTKDYTFLKNFDLATALSSELAGMDISFDRITLPAAGSTVFEVPGEEPGSMDAVKEFTGVILYHHPLFSYYRSAYTGGNAAPDCGSYDGITGTGDPGGKCARCPLNQFGSGENGGKACKNKQRIYILREGELLPVVLTLPTGSMREFGNFLKRLVAKGGSANRVVTRFSLNKAASAGGIAYSQAQFGVARALTEDELPFMDRLFRQSKLYREKWDNVHHANGATYGEETLEQALQRTENVYTPGGDVGIYEANGRYIRERGENVYPLTNFIVNPLEMLVSEDETQMTCDLVNIYGEAFRQTFMTTDFSTTQRFKGMLNKRTIALSFSGNDSDLEALKCYLAGLDWKLKNGVKALGLHECEKRWVFVTKNKAFAAGGEDVPDIVCSCWNVI